VPRSASASSKVVPAPRARVVLNVPGLPIAGPIFTVLD
jgi:hypothetical protein